MITLEMCLDYIEHPKRNPKIWGKIFKNKYPVTLSEAQKKFLGNLCEGKITDTPRNFGKTFLIKLYCECLDYYMDIAKYGPSIPDDYITLEETVEAWKPYGVNPYSSEYLLKAYEIHKEKMLREYNGTPEYMERLKQEIKSEQND